MVVLYIIYGIVSQLNAYNNKHCDETNEDLN